MKNQSKILMVILPVVTCFALLPGAQAQCVDGCNNNFGTFQGDGALINNVAGAGNTAFGWRALFFTSATSFNTGVGGGALALNNSDDNVAVGAAALLLNTSGADNVAVGTDALVFNDSGADNNAIGSFALFNNIGGTFNNAHGRDALFANLGSENNAFGDLALENNTTGGANSAFGDDALDSCDTGSFNVAIGDEAGNTITTGSNNTCVGAGAGIGIVDGTNIIAIGTPAAGVFANFGPTCFIGGINEPTGDPGSTVAVMIDSNNNLGTSPSSRRFKHDIKPMDKASGVLLSLKPVSFKYNHDVKGSTQYGLVAEEVAQVDSHLVVYHDGQPFTVKYDQVNVMLLNEFLKEHKKVEEQQASISQLKGEMQTMVAQLKEQAAQIQKVSAQLEVNKPAPKVVVNKP
jgi:endosialidase-like protein